MIICWHSVKERMGGLSVLENSFLMIWLTAPIYKNNNSNHNKLLYYPFDSQLFRIFLIINFMALKKLKCYLIVLSGFNLSF